MSELEKQIEALEAELSLVINSSEHKLVIDEYDLISQKILSPESTLKHVVDEREMILNLPPHMEGIVYSSEEMEKLRIAEAILESFKTNWEEHDSKIIRSNIVADTIDAMTTATSALSYKYSELWKEWIKELRATFTVSDTLLETQKNLPQLKVLYERYKKAIEQFKYFEKVIPEDKAVISSLINLAKDLSEILNDMDFDVPEEIKKLFDHLNRPYGNAEAPLELITPDVMTWLIDNGEIGHFVVKRR